MVQGQKQSTTGLELVQTLGSIYTIPDPVSFARPLDPMLAPVKARGSQTLTSVVNPLNSHVNCDS